MRGTKPAEANVPARSQGPQEVIWPDSNPLALESAPCHPARMASVHPGHVLILRLSHSTLQPMGWDPHLPMPGPTKSHGNTGGPLSLLCVKRLTPSLSRQKLFPSSTPCSSPPSLPLTSPRLNSTTSQLSTTRLASPCPFLSMRATSLSSIPPRVPTRALSIRHSLPSPRELFPRYTSQGNPG